MKNKKPKSAKKEILIEGHKEIAEESLKICKEFEVIVFEVA